MFGEVLKQRIRVVLAVLLRLVHPTGGFAFSIRLGRLGMHWASYNAPEAALLDELYGFTRSHVPRDEFDELVWSAPNGDLTELGSNLLGAHDIALLGCCTRLINNDTRLIDADEGPHGLTLHFEDGTELRGEAEFGAMEMLAAGGFEFTLVDLNRDGHDWDLMLVEVDGPLAVVITVRSLTLSGFTPTSDDSSS